jgi:N6-adenosine-specific RNA methylase IME4
LGSTHREDSGGAQEIVGREAGDRQSSSREDRAPQAQALGRYDAACRALAEAKAVDEVKEIRDTAVAMIAYARQAKNRDLEADAVEIRMRATRRIDELRQAQKETIGLATGGEHGGRAGLDGSRKNPPIIRPTLAMQGIDKNLAQQARVLGALTEQKFEEVVADARDKVTRAARSAVREVVIEQEREAYRARTYQGCTVDDLHALAESGQRFGVVYADPSWLFEAYSGKGKQRSAERHYDTLPLDEIKALPVARLAADDCALLLWAVSPELPGALEVIEAWGFDYKTVGFAWVKTTPSAECISLDGDGLHRGMGYHTRSNIEVCLLATRGSPTRLAADVPQVVVAPVGEHSAKPPEARRRIERLYPGPYLELFARRPADGWTVWGNEVSPPPPAPAARAGNKQPSKLTETL